MAYRFVRLGETKNYAGPNAPDTPTAVLRATAAVPVGNDDPSDHSNLDLAANSDPAYVGNMDYGAVWIFSDTTSTSSIRVKGGPTSTGPWVILDGGAIANTALATPTVVDIFANGRPEYVIVTTATWSAGNPRAILVGGAY